MLYPVITAVLINSLPIIRVATLYISSATLLSISLILRINSSGLLLGDGHRNTVKLPESV